MRTRLLLILVVVLAWGCRESRTTAGEGSVTTTGEPQPAAVDSAKSVEAESVVPYERKDLGALEVKSIDANPVDWFDVQRDGERAYPGNPPLLNSSIELAPGPYVVVVNRTQRPVTIEAGRKTILWTGNLVVEGQPTHAFWYPMQGGERRLSSNPPLFNKPRALFPGTYTVYVYVSVTTGDELLGEAEVKAGQQTVLSR